jgi:hypothetical protein
MVRGLRPFVRRSGGAGGCRQTAAALPAARIHPRESGGGAREVESQNVAGILPGTDPVLERPVRGADGASRSLGNRRADQRRPHLQRRHGQRFRRSHADRYRAVAERIQAEAAALAAVRRGHGRREGVAGVQVFRRAPHGEAGQHGGRPERGHVSAAVPAAQRDGVWAERIGFGRRNPRGGESARRARSGRPGAGAQHFHPQRSVQLHPPRHPRAGVEGGL